MDVNNIGPRIIMTFGDSGKVFITESTCYAIILAVFIGALGIWMGSNLEKVPKGKQILAEAFVGWIYKFAKDNLGERDGEHFAPFLGSLIIWLFFANSLGLLGLRPVTADIDVTAGLAIVSFIVIQVGAIKKLGARGRIDEMCQPFAFMFPMEIISSIVLPITLALRLFGNIFGGMIVVELWLDFMGHLSESLCGVPFLRCITGIPLNLFFDIFEPAIQAYIFTMLTAASIKEGREGVSQETIENRRLKKEAKLARKRKSA